MAYFAPYIDETGIHMPTYEDRLSDLCDKYRAIFGQEAALDPAVPDYQLLSVFAKALDDTSAYVLSAYNSRNPGYAQGMPPARRWICCCRCTASAGSPVKQTPRSASA